MVVADFIALLGVAGLLFVGARGLYTRGVSRAAAQRTRASDDQKMRDELRGVLMHHDRQALEDFRTLWADRMPDTMRAQVEQRLDELTIEESDHALAKGKESAR